MYWKPAVPARLTAVEPADAVKSMENGVQVDDVLVVDTVNVWLVPAADARIDMGGPPHRWV
jgi:hypothetical protein